MDASPRGSQRSPPNFDPYLPDSSPSSSWKQSYTSNSGSCPSESSPLSVRKRSFRDDSDLYLPDSSPPSAKRSRSSPLRQHESPPIRAPMPLHAQVAGILRAQSPFTRQHVLTQAQSRTRAVLGPGNHNALAPPSYGSPQTSIPRPNGPPPYSYGSSVSLDPALLSPEPYPPAIAAIKQVIPANEGKTIEEMIAALEAHGLGAAPLSKFATNHVSNLSTGMAGSAFDAALDDYYAQSGQQGGSEAKVRGEHS
ncbi:hypothetical protein H2200_011516 [Cladophialophora chaetospira]|uniref:Uncharacterized protein n=1 Tax=Cladophialophora chaetospira TaxID=386627 RepID=A0AA39CD82_9EURO|nr:hypothetical protein H2200_011516 [Cladophialophora chaetospira]